MFQFEDKMTKDYFSLTLDATNDLERKLLCFYLFFTYKLPVTLTASRRQPVCHWMSDECAGTNEPAAQTQRHGLRLFRRPL